MALGSDGNLWFTETLVDKIGKLDVSTGLIREFPLPTQNAIAAGIVAGPDCNLWFTERNSGLIGQVTPGGAITEYQPNAPGGANPEPTGITVGFDGNIYYTEQASSMVAMLSVSNQTCLNDNLPPVAQCQNVTVNTDPGKCSAASASIDNGTSDPDGDTVSETQTPAGLYNLGANAVTLTATDSHNAAASCDATVTVVDNQPPVLSCGGPLTVKCT